MENPLILLGYNIIFLALLVIIIFLFFILLYDFTFLKFLILSEVVFLSFIVFFVSIGYLVDNISGEIMAVYIIGINAAETALGLALLYKYLHSINYFNK